MVPQTLRFLHEQAPSATEVTSPVAAGFMIGMRYYSPERPNQLLWWKQFQDSTELFSFAISELSAVITQLEVHAAINLTFSRVAYLTDVGSGPTHPLLIIERVPFNRGVAFEVEERGKVTNSLTLGDFSLRGKVVAAQRHYSTGLTLLAAEDQMAGLLDAAYMQFYLAIECILDADGCGKAQKNGREFFGARFTLDLEQIVSHVFLARHRFFGHGHPKQQKAHSDSCAAFAIAKQTLVARWCARKLISLELNRDLVEREMQLYPGLASSVAFYGNAELLDSEFKLPT